MNTHERVRQALGGQVIPAVCREGVGRTRLPGDPALPAWRGAPAGIPRHAHTTHAGPELLCFLTGVSPVWLGNRLCALVAGDILLLPPRCDHAPAARLWLTEAQVASPGPATQMAVTFFPFGVTAGFGQTAGDVLYSTPACFLADRQILAAAQALVAEMAERPEGYATVAQGLLLEILGRIARAPVLAGLRTPPPAEEMPPRPVPEPQAVACAREYLHAHYDRPLAIADIARRLQVSPSHLSHEFKRSTGQTVMGYLTEIRIAAAKRLLETPLPVAQIAGLVGYPDPYYFSRVFRQVAGESPTQARERLANREA